jgi:L-iditol 2-dehydrogenase
MEVREAPTPQLTGAHDVLLRVDTVGICGSDIHYYRQPEVGSAVVRYPHITGHELAATVLEVGAEVKCLRAGQRTAVDPLIPCGECDQCLAGRKHTCRRQKFLGYPGQLPGALVEYLVMPAACCSPVPDSLSDDQAAVVEPLSIGLYAARLAQLTSGKRVGIVGSGPIGLCTLLAIRAETPGAIAYVTDLVDNRLTVALTCGAAWTGNPQREDVVASIRHLEPLGLDVVFECAGEQDALDQSVQLLKPGGELLVIGIPEAERISFNASLLRRNELRILNVRRQNECVESAIELIRGGRVDVGPLVTHHFPLEQVADAFEMVSTRKDGVVKALIRVAAA